MKHVLVILLGLTVWAGQADSQEIATSRAEIANQRIEAEVEMRRRAENAAAQAEAETRVESSGADASEASSLASKTAATSGENGPARSRADLSLTLQQIRTLGELRDAGYVTDDEFQRIKERILESAL